MRSGQALQIYLYTLLFTSCVLLHYYGYQLVDVPDQMGIQRLRIQARIDPPRAERGALNLDQDKICHFFILLFPPKLYSITPSGRIPAFWLTKNSLKPVVKSLSLTFSSNLTLKATIQIRSGQVVGRICERHWHERLGVPGVC